MYYVYILSNKKRNVIYTGVTNNLVRRVFEHENELMDGFSKKYRLHDLIYFEETISVEAAIEREKQIKGWCRAKKDELIRSFNPLLSRLNETILG